MASNRDTTHATGGTIDGKHLWLWFPPPCLEGRGKPLLGAELRRKERLLSRTRVCDRDATDLRTREPLIKTHFIVDKILVADNILARILLLVAS
jgi:hypothetical protein